jgi:hypothetical protein
MSYVLKLAKKGRGNVSPNPLVGCIIVKEGKIIGEGYHKHLGDDHAEIEAFNNCIEDPNDADLYVNLENDDISAPEQKNFLLFDVNIITFILLSLSNILKQ